MRESIAPTESPAGLIAPARSYPARTDIPNWKDLNPRFGIVWDPKGDAKTAIKFGINRYVQSATTGMANLLDPAQANSSTTRTWTDSNGNRLPDCDLRSSLAQNNTATGGDICGAWANPNFGGLNLTNSPDPDWITGWQKRPMDWQTAISVDREILPNLVVNAGYFRTWFGNFHGDRQPGPGADRLQPLQRRGAGRSSAADQRPDALRPLRPQPEQVRDSAEQHHLAQRQRLRDGELQRNEFHKQEEVYNGVDVNFQLR